MCVCVCVNIEAHQLFHLKHVPTPYTHHTATSRRSGGDLVNSVHEHIASSSFPIIFPKITHSPYNSSFFLPTKTTAHVTIERFAIFCRYRYSLLARNAGAVLLLAHLPPARPATIGAHNCRHQVEGRVLLLGFHPEAESTQPTADLVPQVDMAATQVPEFRTQECAWSPPGRTNQGGGVPRRRRVCTASLSAEMTPAAGAATGRRTPRRGN